ncbi:MAG: hypothetical protein K9I70_03885 [Chitinophagaceae bacterium]|nr:hypothetical protein [Chitinophagaceae bacterium]
MDKILLDEYKNDPAWAETIKLYSGLFESQNDREQFILNLAECDVLLASECKISSAVEEHKLTNILEEKCHTVLTTNDEPENFSDALKALSNINKNELIKEFIQSIKPNKIPFLTQVISILPHNKTSLELLTLILISNPKICIRPFLNILDNLGRDTIYLETETVQVIFKLILSDSTVKAKYVLQFYRLNKNSIDSIAYIEEAKEKLYYFIEYDEIIEWIRIFKFKNKFKDIIMHLIVKNTVVKGYFTALSLIKSLTDKERLFVLSHLYSDNQIKSKIVFYIYITINFKYKLHFNNYHDFKVKVSPLCLNTYDDFKLKFSEILKREKLIKYKNEIMIGEIITVRFISTRLNTHLFTSNTPFISYLLPFEEIETSKTFIKNELVQVRIIHINEFYNEVYVSLKQLDTTNISFNESYLSKFKINDIVKCKILQRFEEKITVKIYGTSKKQKAVIYKKKELFENVTQLDARLIGIKNNVIILEPIKLIPPAPYISNQTPISLIKEKNLSEWNKIIEYLKRYSVNDEIDLQLLNTQIGFILEKKIKQLFPSNKWLVKALCNFGYLSFENGKYIVIKNFQTERKDMLKNQLLEETSSITSALIDLS